MQSFIDEDYYNELALEETLNPHPKEKKYGDRYAIRKDDGEAWIHSVFHKNDGYRTPLVLNPFRANGVIDLTREYRLTLYRLSAIFVRAEVLKLRVLDEYELQDIHYTYNAQAIKKKYEKLYPELATSVSSFFQRESWMDTKFWNVEKPSTIAEHIVNALNIPFRYDDNYCVVDAQLYVVYKVISIASIYPDYAEYEEIKGWGLPNRPINVEEDRIEKINKLVDKLKRDKSHITIKLRQALNFIRLAKGMNADELRGLRNITFSEYSKLLKEKDVIEDIPTNMRELMRIMPPAIYDIDIHLVKDGDQRGHSISQMSSGERQFLYNSSVFVYHIMNLLSIQDSGRVRYRFMNLVLDEVELSFHPEYQCKFVKKLIDMIVRLRLNQHSAINILIATHSPFILSDIPQANILYLKEGTCANDEVQVNPFAANVNSILQQSFFLKDSFMGDFARYKVHDLIERVQKLTSSSPISVSSLKDEVSMIGDDYLRQQLLSYLEFMDTKRNL